MKYLSIILIVLSLGLASCTSKEVTHKPNTVVLNEVFNLINQARAEARLCGTKSFLAVPKLSYNNLLAKSAQNHSVDMNDADVLSHLSPANSKYYSAGATAIQRIQKEGYQPILIAENIAHNQLTAEELVADWLASPSHCASIMNSTITETGLGHSGTYWTQDFAKPQ